MKIALFRRTFKQTTEPSLAKQIHAQASAQSNSPPAEETITSTPQTEGIRAFIKALQVDPNIAKLI